MAIPLGRIMKELVVLQVETSNICQAKCVFCQHSHFTEFGTMTDKLYTKIINEASQLPGLQTFIPMLTGEPFCDKQIIQRIKYARQCLPLVNIQLYTNGSLLTFEILQQLRLMPNFHLSISLNGLNPETRKRVMGLDDWAHVVRMVRYAEQIKLSYRVTMVAYPEITEKEVRDFSAVGGTAIQYQSWAGQQYHYERKRWTSCIRALSHMTVRYNGDANLCCFDPFGKVEFGNVNTETLEEIWTSRERQEYRDAHAVGQGNKMPMCEACTEG